MNLDRLIENEFLESFLESTPTDGRRKSGPVRATHTLVELRDQHLEMLRLKAIGLTNKEVAQELGVTETSVTQVINSPLAQEKLEEFRDMRTDVVLQATRELDELLPDAVEAYKDVLKKRVQVTPIQRVKVAGEVFDRTGLGRVTKVESRSARVTFTGDELAKMRERALARRGEGPGPQPAIVVEESDDA